MSVLSYPCPACGERCVWSDRFCGACGAAIPPAASARATAVAGRAVPGGPPGAAPTPAAVPRTVGPNGVLRVAVFGVLGWFCTGMIGPLLALLLGFGLMLLTSLGGKGRGLTASDLWAFGGYGLGLVVFVATNLRLLVTIGGT